MNKKIIKRYRRKKARRDEENTLKKRDGDVESEK